MNQESSVLDLLKARHFKFKRQLGQNFIVDPWILNQIADFADIQPGDSVVEVGSGAGTLTEVLAQRQAQVLAIELDRSLIPILKFRLKDYDNIHFIHGDVMNLDIEQAILEKGLKLPYKIVANLPYQISTPFLTMLFRQLKGANEAVILVQKEVANKVVANPGGEGYGMLSLAARWYGKAEIVYELSADSFTPAPPVNSALLKIVRYQNDFAVEEKALWTLIRGVMNQRRKNLLNGLKSLGDFQPRNDITWQEVIEVAKLSGQCRGEDLSLEQFADIVKSAGYGLS